MTIHNVTAGQPGIDITVGNGDFLNVSSGGVASSSVVSNGGTVNISSGGSATFSVVSNGGIENVLSGGTAGFSVVSAGGNVVVFSGGVADFSVISFGGVLNVTPGGTASGTVLSGGWEYLSGGSANTVLSSGNEYVHSGGHADFDVVSSLGKLFAFSGGVASGAVLSGGYEYGFGGGELLDTTVDNGGVVEVENGALATGTVVNGGAQETVFSGGVASGTTVSKGAFELVYGEVSGAVLSGGTQNVYSGGVASGTALNGIGARESVSSGGMAIGTTVGSGGEEAVVGGGFSGSMISSGGMIDLPNIPFSSGGSAILNPQNDVLTVIEGNNSYQQTLSGSYAANAFQASRDPGGATLVTMIGGTPGVLASASAVSPNPVNFGIAHVGGTLVRTLSVTNTAPATSATEALDASIGSVTGAAGASGTITDLTAQNTNNASLIVGLSTASEGVQSGTALVSLESDGTGVESNGITGLPSQTILVSGTIYGFAQSNLPASVNFGAARMGDPAPEQALPIVNGTSASAFQESLIYSLGTPPSDFGVLSGGTGTIASGSSAAATLALSTATPGDFSGSTITVGLTSTGTGTSGLPDTVLTTQPVTLNGMIYAGAVAQLGTTSINFHVVHVGDTVSATVTVANAASGALTDALTGGFGTVTGPFSGLGNLGAGVAAGGSGTLTVDLATTDPGVATGSAILSLASHDSDLPDASVATDPITLMGTVDNYAVAEWEDLSGGGLQQNGSIYTLNLGVIAPGAAAPVVELSALNAATGLADLMSGTFQTSGAGFINDGFTAFSGLGAGQADTAPSISLSTAQIGTFAESITLLATGSNTGGFSGTLTPQVLSVIGTVVGAQTLAWIGAGGPTFTDPLNWVNLTGGLNLGQVAPSETDTVEFNSIGGGIAGTGTVATLVVGSNGVGALQLTDGASITANALEAATASNSVGQIGLTGIGTSLTINGTATIAADSASVLSILSGATFAAAALTLGSQPGSSGQIGVSGAGTGLIISAAATVADAGTGVLSVLSGATFSAASLTIGANKGSSGAVIVSGANSDLVIAGALNIGTALGVGDLTVGPSAAVHASVINLEGQVVLEGGLLDPSVTVINPNKSLGGSGTVASGDIIDEGILQAGDGTPGQLELVQGTIVGGGTLTENGSKVANKANAVGVLQINTFGTMEVDGAVLNAATTTFANDVTPTTTYTVTHSVVDVNFEDSTGVLQLDDIAGFGGTIATFQAGDQFVIAGGALSGLGVNNGTTLTMNDSGNGGTDQIIFGSAVSASYFNIVSGDTVEVVACFAAGTLIETVDGPLAVEALRVGDRVVTNDGCDEPIIWLGRRLVNCDAHPAPETVWPVRVRAGALGPGLPMRDLYLSPDHAVFVNGVLVPVRLLANGTSIAPVRRPTVTYYHVELPRHEVILAEGLTVESYLDTGDRANFNRDGATNRLIPDFASGIAPNAALAWETLGVAPLVLAGAELEAARRAVMDRAPRYRSMRLDRRAA